jgi:hypothetical protein
MSRITSEPIDHAVYLGRSRLGRYSRDGDNLFEAFDAKDKYLGSFPSATDALVAIDRAFSEALR